MWECNYEKQLDRDDILEVMFDVEASVQIKGKTSFKIAEAAFQGHVCSQ